MYCHLSTPDAIAFPIQQLQIWAVDEPNAVSFRVAVGRHVNAVHWTGTNEIEWVKNSDPVLSRLWTKVHEIFGQRRRPCVLANAFTRLSMSRFVRQIFAIVSLSRRKTEQMQMFLALNFFSGGTTPNFLPQIVSAIYRPLFGKVWLSSVCAAKPGNEVESRSYGGWVKTHFQFQAVCGPEVHVVLRQCRRPSG